MVNLTYGENELLLTGTENITDPNLTILNTAWFGIYSQVTKQNKWLNVTNRRDYFPRCDNFFITRNCLSKRERILRVLSLY
jgi:hypothetical protein